MSPAAPTPPASQGDAAARVAHLMQALEREPDNPAHYLALGEAFLGLGEGQNAANCFLRAHQLAPDRTAPLERLAHLFERTGQSAEALNLLLRALAIGPPTAPLLARTAQLQADLGRWDEARQSYERALEQEPQNALYAVCLGDACLKDQDWESARDAYLAALEAGPNLAQAHIQYAQFLANMVRTYPHFHTARGRAEMAEAADHIKKALRLEPANPLAHAVDALLLMMDGRYEDAIAACRRALRQDPGHLQAHHNLVRALTHLGRLAEAEQAAMAMLRAVPDDRSSDSRSDVVRLLPFLMRWQGKMDDNVRYVESLPGEEAPFDNGGDPQALMTAGSLPLAVLCDHPFRICLTVLSAEPGLPLLATKKPKDWKKGGLRLDLDGDGHLRLSLGDGQDWRVDGEVVSGGIPGQDLRSLEIRRGEGSLCIRVNGRETRRFALDDPYRIAGDTLQVGRGGPLGSDQGVKLRSFRCDIERYGDAARARFKPKVHLLSVFYGDLFARVLDRTMMPSLMLPGNLPDLMADHDVHHNVYCTPAEVPLLRRHFRNLDRLGIPWTLDTHILGAGSGPRNRIHLPLIHQIDRAWEEGAVIVMAAPDHVFGQGFAQTLRAMKPLDYLCCGHPRVTMETAFPAYKALFADPEQAASRVTSPALVDFALHGHPHHVTLTGLANPEEHWWNARREGDTYRVRFKEPPPLAFYPSPDLISVISGTAYAPAFETIDHDIVELMDRCGRFRIVDDSRDFFWTEYCQDGRNVPTIRNTYWSPTAQKLAKRDLVWHL